MRVFRGRAATVDADRTASQRLLDVATAGEPAVRVWTPHRQVAFGRRDASEPGYDAARAAARDCGFLPVERDVGGRAVAYDGTTTLAFARSEPTSDLRRGLDDRYERITEDVLGALEEVGVRARRGEPPDSFCPGQRSLQRDGKLVGVAQRVRADAALVAGVCVVAGRADLVDALAAVYGALGVPFDPASVGSVARAGGSADPDRVRRVLEAALVGDARTTVERVGDV